MSEIIFAFLYMKICVIINSDKFEKSHYLFKELNIYKLIIKK